MSERLEVEVDRAKVLTRVLEFLDACRANPLEKGASHSVTLCVVHEEHGLAWSSTESVNVGPGMTHTVERL